jgi:hypothetical protein
VRYKEEEEEEEEEIVNYDHHMTQFNARQRVKFMKHYKAALQ